MTGTAMAFQLPSESVTLMLKLYVLGGEREGGGQREMRWCKYSVGGSTISLPPPFGPFLELSMVTCAPHLPTVSVSAATLSIRGSTAVDLGAEMTTCVSHRVICRSISVGIIRDPLVGGS